MAAYSKQLSALLNDIAPVSNEADFQIRGLAIDSREVKKGYLFIAMPGTEADGRTFIDHAIEKGAAAVVCEQAGFTSAGNYSVPVITVNGLRKLAGVIADRFYDAPSEHLTVIGVTGTNGKTTCSQLLAQALNEGGRRCTVIGTLGVGFPDSLNETFHTTPDVVTVHRLLAEYRDDNVEFVCMEVSSHALAQGRVNEVSFDIAIFTNLSRDHLDYHGDMDEYGAAKALLFEYDSVRYAVINIDDAFGQELSKKLRNRKKNAAPMVVSYGLNEGDVHTLEVKPLNDGLDLQVVTSAGKAHLHSQLFGRFNASNLLAVLATLMIADCKLKSAVQWLGKVNPVPGRVEGFGGDKHPWVVVDYAHTPDALEKVLQALREHTSNRLWCVFGCGGDRDRGKRPQMGKVAEQLADVVILTDDNPRNESPEQIIDNIIAGMNSQPQVVQPRDRAISKAIHEANAGDIVLIAGKGHETYQQIGDQRIPFSDRQTVNEILGEAA